MSEPTLSATTVLRARHTKQVHRFAIGDVVRIEKPSDENWHGRVGVVLSAKVFDTGVTCLVSYLLVVTWPDGWQMHYQCLEPRLREVTA